MEYFEKIEKNPYEDLYWNVPEKKQSIINIIGGNKQSFKTEIKNDEYLGTNYPVELTNVVLPEGLRNDLPPLDNFKFLSATDSGSFAGDGLKEIIELADYNLLIGDLSKNSITGKAIAIACQVSAKPILITRDAVDLIAENQPERVLLNDEISFFGSLVQLQKLLRAVYYPKMLLLSQSLVQVVEVLHKFTLSYSVGIITLHNGQILIAKDGIVKAVPLEDSGYSAITVWSGELAAKVVAMNLYNPNNFIQAAVAAIYHNL